MDDATITGYVLSRWNGKMNDAVLKRCVADLCAFNCVYPWMSQRTAAVDHGTRHWCFCRNPFCLRVFPLQGWRDLHDAYTSQERRFLQERGIPAETDDHTQVHSVRGPGSALRSLLLANTPTIPDANVYKSSAPTAPNAHGTSATTTTQSAKSDHGDLPVL